MSRFSLGLFSSMTVCCACIVGNTSAIAATTPGLPLAPARHTQFTAHEVTWLSPDLSPDGRLLVFDVLGDLYSLPIGGGSATRLTSGMAFDFDPAFESQGRTVTFLSDRSGKRAVWQLAVNADGSPNGSPSPRPDLPVPSSEDTGHARFYMSTPAVQGHEVRSADDIRYSRSCRIAAGITVLGAQAVCEILRESNGVTVPIVQQQGNIEGLTLSRDGRWLAYSHQPELVRTNLHVLDLDSGADRVVLEDSHPIIRFSNAMMLDRYNNERVPRSAFTPDGRALITPKNGRLWLIELTTGTQREIPMTVAIDVELAPLLKPPVRVNDKEVLETQLQQLALAPDGHRFAFRALGKVYVVDDRGGKPRRVTNEHWRSTTWFESAPVWTNDGHSLEITVDQLPATGSGTSERSVWSVALGGKERPQKLARASVRSKQGQTHQLLRLDTRPRNARPLKQMHITAVTGFATPHTDELLPVCGAVADDKGVPIGPPRYLFTVRSRRGATALGYQVPDAFVPYPYAVRISPDGSKIVVHAGGSIALGFLPTKIQAALFALAADENASESSAVADPRCAENADPDEIIDTIPIAVGAEPLWSPDGATLRYTAGPFIYRYELAEAGLAGTKPVVPTKRYQPTSFAVEVRRPVAAPTGTLVLSNARVIPMTGDTVLDGVDIVIAGARIQAIGSHGSVRIPNTARIIDVKGMTVLPGFTDVHTHFGVVPNTQDKICLTYLGYGVTTLFNPNHDWTEAARLVEAGDIIGPRLYSSGDPLYRLGRREVWPTWRAPTASRDQIALTLTADDVAPNLAGYSWITHQIKWRDNGAMRRDAQLFMMAAQRAGFSVAAHHDDLSLTHIMDGFPRLEHAWPTIPLYEDFLRFFAASGTVIVPTLMEDNVAAPPINWNEELPRLRKLSQAQWSGVPQSLYNYNPQGYLYGDDDAYGKRLAYQYEATQLARLVDAGGRVAIGAHGAMHGLGAHLEMYALVDGGLSAMQALRAGTLVGIDVLGFAQDLGTVETGKLADLVVLEKDPLVDIRNSTSVKWIIKNGGVVQTLGGLRSKPIPE